MSVTVVLVDDVADVRAAISQALRLQGGFEVVAEASNGADAVSSAAATQPDVVVLDLGLPDLAGTEVIAELRSVAPDSQVVVYTGSVTIEHAGSLTGVAAFVRKERDIGYLVGLLGDLGRRRHRSASTTVPRRLESVAEARRFVERCCSDWGCEAAVDDSKLIVTELATNAMVHGGTGCDIRVRFAGDVLRFEVHDGGEGAPDLESANRLSERGRGLFLVSALCIAWGVETSAGGGKVVWAELAVSPQRTVDLGTRSVLTTDRDRVGGAKRRPSGKTPGNEPDRGRRPNLDRLSARRTTAIKGGRAGGAGRTGRGGRAGRAGR